MNLFQPQFSEDLDLPETEVRRTILIASTPRSGSHMLGHAMASSGVLGVPYEYLNPANLAEWRRRLGTTTPSDTLHALFKRRTTPNGVFALKTHFDHGFALGGPLPLFAALPGLSVVHIRRGDVLRQAISYAIARQTGVWIAGQEGVQDEARFDAALISRCLTDIALQNARWDAAFRAAGITTLPLFYEDVAGDLAGTVQRVADHAGIALDPATVEILPRTERQSKDSRTDAWVDRYAEVLQGDGPAMARVRSHLVRAIRSRRA